MQLGTRRADAPRLLLRTFTAHKHTCCAGVGLVPYASSFDTPGVLARTVREAAVVANVMSGADPADSTCSLGSTSFVPPTAVELATSAPFAGLRVGVPVEYRVAELAPEVALPE